MQTNEVVHARIDALTAGLSNAVRATGGAEFALMLSMISESQVLVKQLAEFDGADALSPVMNRDQLYSSEIVGQLNQSLKDGHLGELQLLISWLDTVPLQGRVGVQVGAVVEEGVSMAQAAVLARKYGMLDEVRESRLSFAA